MAPNLYAVDDWRSGARPLPVSVSDADRIWKPGHFRLFVSHSSTHKQQVGQLSRLMAVRHVDAFVAHKDIEPCREWQDEIRMALASCHGMLAYVTPGFHESIWCMQEVGWALGRGVLAVSVKAPDDPKGFLGIGQAMPIPEGLPYMLRDAVIDVLWRNDRTHRQLHEAAVLTVERAVGKQAALVAARFVSTARGLSQDHAKRLLEAVGTNSNVKASDQAVKLIEALAASVGVGPTSAGSVVDEYDPFADE